MERFRTQPLTDLNMQQDRKQLARRVEIREHIQDLLELADLLDSGSATAAQQRQGLVMAMRGVARLARYLVT